MPIYEYKCPKCNSQFEYLAKNTDDEAKTCPECGAKHPVKQLSTFSAAASGPSIGSSCSTGDCSTGTCPFT